MVSICFFSATIVLKKEGYCGKWGEIQSDETNWSVFFLVFRRILLIDLTFVDFCSFTEKYRFFFNFRWFFLDDLLENVEMKVSTFSSKFYPISNDSKFKISIFDLLMRKSSISLKKFPLTEENPCKKRRTVHTAHPVSSSYYARMPALRFSVDIF